MSKLDILIKKLGIDESATKVLKSDKIFTHVKDNIPHKDDYNYSADLLVLPAVFAVLAKSADRKPAATEVGVL